MSGKVLSPLLGLADEEFMPRRPGSSVMTKREVRAITLANLRLHQHTIMWDIGSGTGSVAIEAAHLASALQAEKLIFLSNIQGICHRDGSLISELTAADAQQLLEEGVISGGMIPKVSACLNALDVVPCMHIVDGREPHVLVRELFTDQGAGTMIVRSKR